MYERYCILISTRCARCRLVQRCSWAPPKLPRPNPDTYLRSRAVQYWLLRMRALCSVHHCGHADMRFVHRDARANKNWLPCPSAPLCATLLPALANAAAEPHCPTTTMHAPQTPIRCRPRPAYWRKEARKTIPQPAAANEASVAVLPITSTGKDQKRVAIEEKMCHQ